MMQCNNCGLTVVDMDHLNNDVAIHCKICGAELEDVVK